MRAVRFETGLIELELSNRLQTKASPGSSSYLKLFGKCQVDLNLALGQIVKHQVSTEYVDVRTMAFKFCTSILTTLTDVLLYLQKYLV